MEQNFINIENLKKVQNEYKIKQWCLEYKTKLSSQQPLVRAPSVFKKI